jgi:hypothetical protein
MIPPSSDLPELRDLLDALCDETITAEQVERLEELVLNQPEAEAFYVQYLSLHADMIAHFGALASGKGQTLRDRVEADLRAMELARDLKRNSDAAFQRRISGRPLAIALTTIAAGLLLAFVFWDKLGFQQPQPRQVIVAAPPAEVLDDSVAVLLQATGAQWETTELPTAIGSPLQPGWLRLKSGLAHIEFYSGANVILEGPADFQIISRMKAYCARGRLRATVPKQAQGFEIGSPKMNLIDRGTEFGLMVTENGPTELHVFEGKVEFNESDVAKTKSSYTALTTGQSVRLDGSGQLSSINSDSMAFHTAQDLMVSSEAEIRRTHQGWSEFGAQLRRDQSLLAHFTFQAEDSWSRTLANEMRPSEVQDGAIVGCSWAPGRWAGKNGLEFTQVSDRVRCYIPGDYTSLTFMAWVRIDALPNQFNSLFMTDGWEDGETHWHIGSSGTLELGIQGLEKKVNAHYEAPQAINRERFGGWTHLAVVYNGESGYVAHFVNGQSIAHLPLKFATVLRIGEAEIGNWNISKHRNQTPVRNFNGCIDEFIVFGRALGEPEIEQIYHAGRPPQN